jgi:hypothetical protein
MVEDFQKIATYVAASAALIEQAFKEFANLHSNLA